MNLRLFKPTILSPTSNGKSDFVPNKQMYPSFYYYTVYIYKYHPGPFHVYIC